MISSPWAFDASDIEVDQEDVRRGGLRTFVRLAWPILEPATPFIPNWHIDCICDHLEAVTKGDLRRVIFNVPPGSCKSLLISVLWPVYHWILYPSDRFLTASHADTLSIRDALKSRRVMQSEWFRACWGDIVKLTGDQNQKSRYENNRTGYRIATHVGGATGERAKIKILDDPHNIEQAHSKKIREGVVDWVRQTWSQRESDPRTSVDVVVMQRLHDLDVSGYLLKEVGGYEHVRIPMRYVPEHHFKTSIGWEDPRKTTGESLMWEVRWNEEDVKRKEALLGTLGTSGQLQQHPVPLEGNLVKKSWFRYFDTVVSVTKEVFYILHRPEGDLTIARKQCTIIFTVDLAASQSTMADYTVVSVWAVVHELGALLWLDCTKDRMEGPDQRELITKLYETWKPDLIGVESNAYQLTMFQDLIREGLPGYKIKSDHDKISRFIPAGNSYKNGIVYHPVAASWLTDVETELLHFPNGEHDDCVDTCSFAYGMLRNVMGGGTMDVTGT